MSDDSTVRPFVIAPGLFQRRRRCWACSGVSSLERVQAFAVNSDGSFMADLVLCENCQAPEMLAALRRARVEHANEWGLDDPDDGEES